MTRTPFDATAWDLIAGTAIIALCCAAAVYLPVLGFVCFFLLPLPVIFYHVRFGAQTAFFVSVLGILIFYGLTRGFNSDTILMAGMLGHGFLLGKYVKRHTPIEKTIAYSTLTILGAGFLFVVLAGNLAGTGAFSLVSEHIKKNLDVMISLYKQVETSDEMIRLLEASVEKIHYALLAILPALTASMLAIAAWINLLLGRIILRAAGFHSPALGHLNVWQAPDGLVWGVIGCGLFLLFPFQAPRVIALNILIVAMMVYLLQGFAIISFYFDKKEVPLFIRVLVYGALVIQQFLLLFVIGLGFFDTWFNLRRINSGDKDQLSS